MRGAQHLCKCVHGLQSSARCVCGYGCMCVCERGGGAPAHPACGAGAWTRRGPSLAPIPPASRNSSVTHQVYLDSGFASHPHDTPCRSHLSVCGMSHVHVASLGYELLLGSRSCSSLQRVYLLSFVQTWERDITPASRVDRMSNCAHLAEATDAIRC